MLRIPTVLTTLALLAVGLGAGTASARTNVLPDATYNALVTAYEAIEALEPDEDAKQLPKNYFASIRKVCKAIPATDQLLESTRATCTESYVLIEAMFKPCATERSCLRQLEKSATSAKRYHKLAVAENAIIAKTVPAGPCRKTLSSTAKDLRDARDLGRIFTSLARALEADNEKAYLKAAKRLGAVMKDWDESGDEDDTLLLLAEHC